MKHVRTYRCSTLALLTVFAAACAETAAPPTSPSAAGGAAPNFKTDWQST